MNLKKILLASVLALGIAEAANAQVALQYGQVGYSLTSTILSGSAVTYATTATPYNLTSLSVPPGHWSCQASVVTTAAGTTLTASTVAFNTTSATLPTAPANGYATSASSGTIPGGVTSATYNYDNLTGGAQTLYTVIQAAFTGAAPTGYGQMTCWQRG